MLILPTTRFLKAMPRQKVNVFETLLEKARDISYFENFARVIQFDLRKWDK